MTIKDGDAYYYGLRSLIKKALKVDWGVHIVLSDYNHDFQRFNYMVLNLDQNGAIIDFKKN